MARDFLGNPMAPFATIDESPLDERRRPEHTPGGFLGTAHNAREATRR
jgi:hypothetical protein